MGNPTQLVKYGRIQSGMTMAMKVGPNGGVAIQIPLPIAGDEPRTLSSLDRNRGKPRVHPKRGGGKRMPKMRPIQPDDLVVFQFSEWGEVRGANCIAR